MSLSCRLLIACLFTTFVGINSWADDTTQKTESSIKAVQQANDDEDLIIEEDVPEVANDSVKQTAPASSVAPKALADSVKPTQELKPVQPGSVNKSVPDASISEDADLILDGGEEDILKENASVKKPVQPIITADSATKVSNQESKNSVAPQTPQQGSPQIGSNGQPPYPNKYRYPPPSSQPNSDSAQNQKAQTVQAPLIKGPAKIEETQSINFARNLKDYKSPKLAMLFSLLLPGAGEAYTGAYWKAALFGVIEAAIIGTGVGFALEGKQKKKDAHKLADQHFSTESLRDYYKALETALKGSPKYADDTLRNELISTLFYDSATFYDNARHKNTDYYSSIEGRTLVQGWDDCEPKLDQILKPSTAINDSQYAIGNRIYQKQQNDSTFFLADLIKGGTGDPLEDNDLLGFSELQNRYKDLISQSNRSYRNSNSVLYLLILNHIVSAIDAGITAKSHNDRLLGQETFWQHINIEQRYVNTGNESVPGIAFNVRF